MEHGGGTVRQTQFSKVLIISAELNGNSFESNKQRSLNLESCLEDLGLKIRTGLGLYKGTAETCYVVLPKDHETFRAVIDLAFRSFEQESVLYQDGQGNAWLYGSDDSIKKLGKLRGTSEHEAKKQDSYTFFMGSYYTTTKGI